MSRKGSGRNEISPEIWKTKKFGDIPWFCNVVYKQNATEKRTKICILYFPKKGDLGITENYSHITRTAIAANLYGDLLLDRRKREIQKSIHNFIDSDCPSNHRKFWIEKSRGNTTARRFPLGIWFYT